MQALQLKRASLGGEQESGFEQAFSSLAFAYLKDKAPRLIDFIVGFQLVDRNEDNTKAMGVFGFKLGEQWIYAPVFFLNGDLKGHELLYVKKQDMFVPMKENWVNYLMAKKPHIMGERSPKDTFQLGGMSPNIEQLSWPPEQSKFSADQFHRMVKEGIDRGVKCVEDWAQGVMPMISAAIMKSARFLFREAKKGTSLDMDKVASAPLQAVLAGQKFDLTRLLQSNVHIAKAAWDMSRQYPRLKQAFDKFYGPDFFPQLGQTIKTAFQRERTNIMPVARPAAPAAPGKFLIPEEKQAAGPPVRVITRDDVATVQNLPELTEEERKKLLNDGVLIVDRREGEEVSKSYNTQAAPQTLTNVQETGLYDILEKPGDFTQHLVIANPYSNKGQEAGVTTIRLADGDKAWKNIVAQALWHRHVETRDVFQKWFDDQGGSESLKKGGTYVAIGERGQGTVPFVVRQDYGDGCYKVDFECHFDEGPRRPGDMSHTFYDDFNDHDGGYVSPYGAKLFLNKRPDSEVRAVSGELHIPDKLKIIKIKSPPKPKKDEGCCRHSIMGGPMGDEDDYDGTGSSPSPIKPGDIADIQLHFTQKTARMKIYSDHNEVTITTEKTGNDRMSPLKGVLALVRQHGLTEKAAREMIKTAQRKGQEVFRIKYAQPFPHAETTGPGPNSPQFPAPETGTENHGYRMSPSIYPQEEFLSVEGLQSDLTDPKIYDPFLMPDQNAVSMATQAGEQGQKEVFDVGMISGLLKSVRQDSLVDRYLGDLMKALDRLGRMLFMFYWHGEEFEERYGKHDLPELEDSIRNAFETLGDVTLFLKEKTIDGGEDEMGDPSIEEVARN